MPNSGTLKIFCTLKSPGELLKLPTLRLQPKSINPEFPRVVDKMSIVCKDHQLIPVWSKVWESRHRQNFLAVASEALVIFFCDH